MTGASGPVRVTSSPATARPGDEPMVVLVYRADVLGGEVVRSAEHDADVWLDVDGFAATTTLTRLVEAARRALETDPG